MQKAQVPCDAHRRRWYTGASTRSEGPRRRLAPRRQHLPRLAGTFLPLQYNISLQPLKLPQNGILQGIRKGSLTTAQFSVLPDPANQAKVIESYRFSFQYNNSTDHPAAQLTDLAISAATQTSVSVKSIRCGLIELLRLVSLYTERMPDLPGKVLSLAGQSCLRGACSCNRLTLFARDTILDLPPLPRPRSVV